MFLPALVLLGLLLAACAAPRAPATGTAAGEPAPSAEPIPAPRIAIALGGGAAKGFAHIGVIKSLESHGIQPDLVAGTSAGSVVAALYAGGIGGFELQKIALSMDEGTVGDWVFPNRGFIKGEALQNFINETLRHRPIEKLDRRLAVVATDLQSGDMMVFRSGNAGQAVRASSSVPGIFQPVTIQGREYVDGGLVSPVPVRVARDMGADIVVAVDISERPGGSKLRDSFDVLLQTFTIMGRAIAGQELGAADVVIAPQMAGLKSASFESRNLAILEGEKAGLAAIAEIQARIAAYYDKRKKVAAGR